MNNRQVWIDFISNTNEGARQLYKTISNSSVWPEHMTIDEFEMLFGIAQGCFDSLNKRRNNYGLKDAVRADVGFDLQLERNYAECQMVKYLMKEMGLPINKAIKYFEGMSDAEREKEFDTHFRQFCVDLQLSILGGVVKAEDISNRLFATNVGMRKTKGKNAKSYHKHARDYAILDCVDKIMTSMGKNEINLHALYRCKANADIYEDILSQQEVSDMGIGDASN